MSMRRRILDQTCHKFISDKGAPIYNVYSIDGQRILSRATSLTSLEAGVYIINGKKTLVK